jgi:hypothetical protein
MLSSKTLKTFVKMHEYKLNAKINDLKAGRLESELDSDLHQATDHSSLGASQHWNMNEADSGSRRRPKSHYFDFILTAQH